MTKIFLLASYLFAAMTTWVPIQQHSFYEKAKTTQARYLKLAETMSQVALNPQKTPVFEGKDARVKTALLLASIASTESGYARNIVNCQRGGDNNLAWGPWQTHTNKYRTCSNLLTAAGYAMHFAQVSFHWCHKQKLLNRLSGYTDGKCRPSAESRRKIARALQWYQKYPLSFNK